MEHTYLIHFLPLHAFEKDILDLRQLIIKALHASHFTYMDSNCLDNNLIQVKLLTDSSLNIKEYLVSKFKYFLHLIVVCQVANDEYLHDQLQISKYGTENVEQIYINYKKALNASYNLDQNIKSFYKSVKGTDLISLI